MSQDVVYLIFADDGSDALVLVVVGFKGIGRIFKAIADQVNYCASAGVVKRLVCYFCDVVEIIPIATNPPKFVGRWIKNAPAAPFFCRHSFSQVQF